MTIRTSAPSPRSLSATLRPMSAMRPCRRLTRGWLPTTSRSCSDALGRSRQSGRPWRNERRPAGRTVQGCGRARERNAFPRLPRKFCRQGPAERNRRRSLGHHAAIEGARATRRGSCRCWPATTSPSGAKRRRPACGSPRRRPRRRSRASPATGITPTASSPAKRSPTGGTKDRSSTASETADPGRRNCGSNLTPTRGGSVSVGQAERAGECAARITGASACAGDGPSHATAT